MRLSHAGEMEQTEMGGINWALYPAKDLRKVLAPFGQERRMNKRALVRSIRHYESQGYQFAPPSTFWP